MSATRNAPRFTPEALRDCMSTYRAKTTQAHHASIVILLATERLLRAQEDLCQDDSLDLVVRAAQGDQSALDHPSLHAALQRVQEAAAVLMASNADVEDAVYAASARSYDGRGVFDCWRMPHPLSEIPKLVPAARHRHHNRNRSPLLALPDRPLSSIARKAGPRTRLVCQQLCQAHGTYKTVLSWPKDLAAPEASMLHTTLPASISSWPWRDQLVAFKLNCKLPVTLPLLRDIATSLPNLQQLLCPWPCLQSPATAAAEAVAPAPAGEPTRAEAAAAAASTAAAAGAFPTSPAPATPTPAAALEPMIPPLASLTSLTLTPTTFMPPPSTAGPSASTGTAVNHQLITPNSCLHLLPGLAPNLARLTLHINEHTFIGHRAADAGLEGLSGSLTHLAVLGTQPPITAEMDATAMAFCCIEAAAPFLRSLHVAPLSAFTLHLPGALLHCSQLQCFRAEDESQDLQADCLLSLRQLPHIQRLDLRNTQLSLHPANPWLLLGLAPGAFGSTLRELLLPSFYGPVAAEDSTLLLMFEQVMAEVRSHAALTRLSFGTMPDMEGWTAEVARLPWLRDLSVPSVPFQELTTMAATWSAITGLTSLMLGMEFGGPLTEDTVTGVMRNLRGLQRLKLSLPVVDGDDDSGGLGHFLSYAQDWFIEAAADLPQLQHLDLSEMFYANLFECGLDEADLAMMLQNGAAVGTLRCLVLRRAHADRSIVEELWKKLPGLEVQLVAVSRKAPVQRAVLPVIAEQPAWWRDFGGGW